MAAVLREKRSPDSSIQHGKKRLGGLGIVFMGIRVVTDYSGGNEELAEGRVLAR